MPNSQREKSGQCITVVAFGFAITMVFVGVSYSDPKYCKFGTDGDLYYVGILSLIGILSSLAKWCALRATYYPGYILRMTSAWLNMDGRWPTVSRSRILMPSGGKQPAKPVHTPPGNKMPSKTSELDLKVKGLLVQTPAKLTEWLIRQGLLRRQQYDTTNEGRIKLKLGMNSDGKKFPQSGGYMWIQGILANNYTSVYKGSIFASNHAPTVTLKMIYHWACQTNIHNVAHWIKVDNEQIERFYRHLRCICVGAVQDEINNIGGPHKVVEIGVISLGTISADGQKKEIKVDVLGVLDRTTKNLRLRATEPIQGASQSERFGKIFETLPTWINKHSQIVTDYGVDREILLRFGFKNVSQRTLNAGQTHRTDNTNQQIVDYLKKQVPKVFQNTLANLTIPTIQQFLDELTFRELFGQYPLACFNQIIQKITAQTNATAQKEETMFGRLNRIATNPFDNWCYSSQPELLPRHTTPSPNRYGIDALSPSLRALDAFVKRASSVEPNENIDIIVSNKMKAAAKSAYTNKEEAKKVRRMFRPEKFAPTISLDKEEQKMAKGMDSRISISKTHKVADDSDKGNDQEEGHLKGPVPVLAVCGDIGYACTDCD